MVVRQILPAALAGGLWLALACGEAPPSVAADREPERLRVQVLAEYPHRPDAFTQGLLHFEDRIYESTGQYGRSSVRRVVPESGAVERRAELPEELFGEGLARIGRRLYQLTWQEERGLIWDLDSLARVGEFSYSGEGWGLCFDSSHLVRSDGSNVLTFHEPADFRAVRRVAVTVYGRPALRLNELECVEGAIYANVWGSDEILRIDPASGRVLAVIDASGLLPQRQRKADNVLNGIAWVPERGTFLLTGKNWPTLYEVVLEAVEPAGRKASG